MNKGTEIDKIEMEKRVYQVSLMLRRKSMPFILQFISENWHVGERQARNYVRLARKEWAKYFLNLKNSGMSYFVSQLRDLKDQAYSRKVIMGRGDNKDTVTIADLGLVFEITKEEAKIMGIYAPEKHDIKLEGEITVNARKKLIDKINSIASKGTEEQTT